MESWLRWKREKSISIRQSWKNSLPDKFAFVLSSPDYTFVISQSLSGHSRYLKHISCCTKYIIWQIAIKTNELLLVKIHLFVKVNDCATLIKLGHLKCRGLRQLMDTAEGEIASFPVMVLHLLIIESDILLKKMDGTRYNVTIMVELQFSHPWVIQKQKQMQMSIKIASLS